MESKVKSKSHGDSPHSPWRVRELESEGMGDRVISNTRRKGSVKTKDLTGAKAIGTEVLQMLRMLCRKNKVTENCLQGTTGMKQGEDEK